MCFSLNNAHSLHLSQRVDKRRGGPFISRFTELLNASWEEGEILRGRFLRKALVITFSFESAFVPSRTRFFFSFPFFFFFIALQGVITNVTKLKKCNGGTAVICASANCEFRVIKSA